MSKKNKKKNKKVAEAEQQEEEFKLDRKTVIRIGAGILAGLMILGTITMTIMYLLEGGHVH